jgi:hypothetical protein
VRTYNVADATAAGGERTRVLGTLYAPRRKPTAEEVREINASLAAMEAGEPATSPAPRAARLDGSPGATQD